MPKNGLLPSKMNNLFCLNELRCLKRVGFCNFDGSKTLQKSSPFKTALKSAGHQGLKCGIVTNVDLAERHFAISEKAKAKNEKKHSWLLPYL